ncbi:hypothetical protein IE53DRAFT_35014 [Violaceomyces palustris]|uniref:Uncharacterized protein n=1 Tax=Violaceomyces palustris TaxID=1673888 RepID=A0ACD0P1K1_9BASI|nr:hypothetical protein IE53DRAFT_35014 [Violaceomyces palustris]
MPTDSFAPHSSKRSTRPKDPASSSTASGSVPRHSSSLSRPALPSSSSLSAPASPRQPIQEEQQRNYKFNIRPASVAKFPAASPKIGEKQDEVRDLPTAQERGKKRLSKRILTEIDSPSPSSSQTNLRVSNDGHGHAPPSLYDSKILTSFPFPHPTTPNLNAKGSGEEDSNGGYFSLARIGRWIEASTSIFAGPYERSLQEEERRDNEITRGILRDIEVGRRGHVGGGAGGKYGSLARSGSESDELADPYGYRSLAGPTLLPSYSADLAARRRDRRRARSRARFQCMAIWTIWAIVFILVLGGLISMFVVDRANPPRLH